MIASFTKDKRKVGIAIPTYQKCDDVVQCIQKIKDDDRIETITIIDDCSELTIYELLELELQYEEKVRLGRNDTHIGDELNQHRAILLSDSDYVLCVNPKTVLDATILDDAFGLEWNEKIFATWNNKDVFFVNRTRYIQDSPHSIHLEKQEEEEA